MEKNHLDVAIRAIAGSNIAYDTDGKTILKWRTPDIPQPSQKNIDAKIVELEAEWTTLEYARNRALAFPSIGDQLDMLFHDMTTDKGTKDGEWYKAVAKVKEDNPKPDGWKE